jgi:DNA repair protein RadC
MRDEDSQQAIEDVTQIETITYRAVSRPPSRPLGKALHSSSDVFGQLVTIRKADREHFVVFDLDVRHRIIARRVVHIGTLSGVEVHPREVFRDAVVNAAAAIILAHNHPSGDPTPSRQDLEITARLRQVGELLGITVLDHVIVACDGFISLAERDWQ